MALDPSKVDWQSKQHVLRYDWRTLATYALGVGARREELPFLYERTEGGIRVLPSFAVVPANDAVFEALTATGADLTMVVHGGQVVKTYEPIATEGSLETVASIRAIHDLKRFAQVVVDTKTHQAGTLVYETTWAIIVRGAGGFGGPRPPADPAPSIPKDTTPTFRRVEQTTPEQALLYRLSGDVNPLHADPAFATSVGFPQGPILHGLATFGFLTRAVVHGPAGGDPRRIAKIAAQFRKPVWPGDTLSTTGYDLGGGTFALGMEVEERREAVLSNAYVELRP
jgi:acyl dehydratase